MSNWLSSAKIMHLAAARQAAAPVEVSIPFDPVSELTAHQQAALLSMRETVAARACVRKLLEDSQDRYSGGDFAALRQHGLAQFKSGYRLHQPTPQGRVAAMELQKSLCKSLAIHIMSSALDSGATNFFSCSCGEWSTSVSRGIYAESNAARMFSRHKVSAQTMGAIKGALKPMGKEQSA